MTILRSLATPPRHAATGVFWHTQGSGKAFDGVLCAQIFRKLTGNSLLVVTDRDDWMVDLP
ncbi:hypothetical protein [Rhodoferax sp.]|uniref:hypothetical protein n=1 Tax=Rhodoferax sp. TaxID=50421 RepID=UPI002ACE1597|nr:hypothetical protein [Rhodoferax sp.]MDZ7921384.1 hypothetical protein [Rhodoferax sp.]